MHLLTTRLLLALSLTLPVTLPAHAQTEQAPIWRGCCGVSPWPSSPAGGAGMMGGGHGAMMGSSAARNHFAMKGQIPAPYTNASNPLTPTAATIQHGAAVYSANCASCHGTTGLGDGPAARGLSPKPANLAWLSRMPMSRIDPFMYWTIAEGGSQFETAMPSFKGSLAKDDIWSVIAYIQAHLPAPKPVQGGR